MSEVAKRCERVRRRLPAYVHGDLRWWRRRLVARHLRRCEDCAAEEDRQQQVAAGLADLGAATEESLDDVAPPEDLLATLLDQAREPGLRQRVAVPARGAISGARPGLSLALVATVLAVATLAGWAGWRLGRGWRDRRAGAAGAAADPE